MLRKKVSFFQHHLYLVREDRARWNPSVLTSRGYHSLAAVRWLAAIDKYLRLSKSPVFANKLVAVKFESFVSSLQRSDLLKALAHFIGLEQSMDEKEFDKFVAKHAEEVKIEVVRLLFPYTTEISYSIIPYFPKTASKENSSNVRHPLGTDFPRGACKPSGRAIPSGAP